MISRSRLKRLICSLLKHGLAFLLYLVILVVLDFIMGIGLKDPWDKFNRRSR